jgi:hypothetical protein
MTVAGRQAGVKDFRNAPTPRRGAPARARRATGMSPRPACGRTHNGGSSDVRVIPGPGGVERSQTFMRFQSRRSDRTADCWPFICRNRMHSHPSADGMRLPRGVCPPSAHPWPRRTSDRQEGICNPLFSAVARAKGYCRNCRNSPLPRVGRPWGCITPAALWPAARSWSRRAGLTRLTDTRLTAACSHARRAAAPLGAWRPRGIARRPDRRRDLPQAPLRWAAYLARQRAVRGRVSASARHASARSRCLRRCAADVHSPRRLRWGGGRHGRQRRADPARLT